MRLIKYIILTAFLGLVFVSCENKFDTTFSDEVAFVAIDGPDNDVPLTVDKNVGEIALPIHLSSVSGLSATATIEAELETTTAVSPRHYEIQNTTFNFTAEHKVDTVRITIHSEGFIAGEGDKVLTLRVADIVPNTIKTLLEEDNTVTIIIKE